VFQERQKDLYQKCPINNILAIYKNERFY
jgi:hypothetical protein